MRKITWPFLVSSFAAVVLGITECKSVTQTNGAPSNLALV